MKLITGTISRCIAVTSNTSNCRLLSFETNVCKNSRFFRNVVVLQLLSKEPLKIDPKPTVVPPFISANGVHNANQNSTSTEKKNAHLPNTGFKPKNKLDDKQIMNDSKILDDSTFTTRFINKIENWSPFSAKYARLSIFGSKYLYKDIRVLLTAYRKYYTSDLSSLSYAELELKYRLPTQLIRLTPNLILRLIPFSSLLLFPIIFMFPKYLLSDHYWTDEQFKEYYTKDQQKSFEHSIRVFEHLNLMAEECSDDMLLKWFRVIECLGAGGVSPVDDIIQAIPVFTMYPYHLSTLPRQHIACLFRGLNPFSSPRETLELYLENWIKISSKIDNDSLSCILHCQVLLALNRPENDTLKKNELINGA